MCPCVCRAPDGGLAMPVATGVFYLSSCESLEIQDVGKERGRCVVGRTLLYSHMISRRLNDGLDKAVSWSGKHKEGN